LNSSKRLNGVDVEHADPFEFVLDHVEQKAMQTLHHRQRIQIPGQEPGFIRREGRMHTHDVLRNAGLRRRFPENQKFR
jgi:hypothetical protein